MYRADFEAFALRTFEGPRCQIREDSLPFVRLLGASHKLFTPGRINGVARVYRCPEIHVWDMRDGF